MINFSQLNEVQIILFGLVLIRMSAFVVAAPLFNSQSISPPLKILFSLVFSIAVYSSIATNEALARVSDLQSNLILLALREVALGLILGFVCQFFFFVIAMAGEMVSVSMGLGQAQMFNPMMGSMGNAIEQFYTVIATLVFLAVNGHHLMLTGLVESFTTAPIAQLTFNMGNYGELVLKMQSFFIFGIKMAAPLVVSMLIVQLGIALVSRLVPQINVLTTSSSLTVLVGFVILFVSLPLLVMQMTGLTDFSMGEFFKFIKVV